MYYGNTFNIFAEKELSGVLDKRLRDMQGEINNKPDNYILNVNENEFVSYLVEKYSARNLNVQFDNISVSTYEKQIPADMFPGRGFLFNVESGRSYTKDVVRYYIPFSGDEEFLRCVPNPRMMRTVKVSIEDNCVCFDIVNFYDDPERIKQEYDSTIFFLRRQVAYVVKQIDDYNASLSDKAREFFQARKQHLLKKKDILSSLGVPIKKRDNVSSTFAIPTPQTQRKIQISPPVVMEDEFQPEPTLDSSTYQDILQVIHDVGKQFERMPSTYSGKQEEDLRDHILLLLEPRFEGSATGETFNKMGKTDILLRYKNSNVFIAECKFWKGAKAYLDTISQLLGYLTWRDSKSAIVLFVKNKGFSSVLNTVEEATPKHSNYLGFSNKKDETWLNYRFHINDDPNREVKMAVLLFHIPPT